MDESALAAFVAQETPTFDAASALVVDFLKEATPLSYWAVTRFDGYRQLYLEVRDDSYGLQAGDWHAWEDSMCVRMVAGEGPQIAPDAMAIPAYAAAKVTSDLPVGTYVGIPIVQAEGELFGTLCGMDPNVQADDFADNQALFDVVASLLSMVLDADLEKTKLARALERAESLAETDGLTGLLNRRGWERVLSVEEARLRRFGDPGAVIVLDLDHLKEINDSEGHAAGDRYIAAAGEALRSCVRTYDFAARLGGDEFGVLATGLLPADCASLVTRIENAFKERGVSASVGYARYDLASGLPAAWTAADKAMYLRKRIRAEERETEILGGA